jgi:spermidine synthase
LKKYLLEAVVFICGAVVMVFEIVGSRVLGPYLGTSIFTWTSLIGIILASLSLGYWLGGLFADRKPSVSRLSRIILISALLILAPALFKDLLLKNLPSLVSGLKAQAVLASLVIFAPASIFLGMISPYAVRLRLKALESSGSTVGRLYAISTVGSIAGTFAAGFYLIPAFGTNAILHGLAVLLALTSLMLALPGGSVRNNLPSLIVLLACVYGVILVAIQPSPYTDVDTRYNRVWIYPAKDPSTGKPVMFMRINNESSSARFIDSSGLVFRYAGFYRLAEHFNPGFSRGLVLGGAGYTFPMYFLEAYPNATVDVVEIDEELTLLARDHFGLRDNPRMRIFHEDARTFLNRGEYTYDVIYGDTFKSLYTLPWQLTTREAADRMYKMLNDDGVVLVNIISAIQGNKSDFIRSELATFRDVFPRVFVYAVDDPSQLKEIQSLMLVASKNDSPESPVRESSPLQEYLQNEVTSMIVADLPVLTDDHAPVDFLLTKALK